MAPKRKKNDEPIINNELITLTDDDGKSYQFELIEFFAVGKKTFAIMKEEGDKEGNLAILKVKVGAKGKASQFTPPTEEEWNEAIDALGCFDEGEDDGEGCCGDNCADGAADCCCGCADEDEAPVKKATGAKASKAKASSKSTGEKELEAEIVTVKGDDGVIRRCELLEVFAVGKKSFAIVHELEAPENEAVILKVKPGAKGKAATYVEPTEAEWNQATDTLGCVESCECGDDCDCGEDCECGDDCACGDDCCSAGDEVIEPPVRKAGSKAKPAAKAKAAPKAKPAAKGAAKVAPQVKAAAKVASKAKPAAKVAAKAAPKAKPAAKVAAKAAPKAKPAAKVAAKAAPKAKPAAKAKPASRRSAW